MSLPHNWKKLSLVTLLYTCTHSPSLELVDFTLFKISDKGLIDTGKDYFNVRETFLVPELAHRLTNMETLFNKM